MKKGKKMEQMDDILAKAQVLVEALPYIQRFNRKIIVVKYGGSAMVDEQLKKSVIQDVVLLKLVGFKPMSCICNVQSCKSFSCARNTGNKTNPLFMEALTVVDDAINSHCSGC